VATWYKACSVLHHLNSGVMDLNPTWDIEIRPLFALPCEDTDLVMIWPSTYRILSLVSMRI